MTDPLLASAVEAARTMGTRRLTRTSLLRMADAYMAYLAELAAIEQAESLPVYDGPAEEVPHMECDLNSAIARYRQMLEHPSGDGFPYESPQQLRNDQRVIIDAYLARLAEDEQRVDDGPVTEEWLRENGWQLSPSGTHLHYLVEDDQHAYELASFLLDDSEIGGTLDSVCGDDPPPAFKNCTRRQLRRLIAALEG